MVSLRALVIGWFILAGVVSANPIAQIVAFGDSLIDAGNHFALGAPASPPYFQGRFADGAVWVEVLAAGIGVPAPLPSRLGGTNYAWAGAETAESGMSARGTPNVGTQITAYLDTRPTIAPESTLFVIGGGGNDFLQHLSDLPDPSGPVSNLTAAIARLAQAGATTFMVASLPLLGERPLVRRDVAANRGPGIVDVLNQRTTEFNAQWFAATMDLEARLGIRVYRLDVNDLFERVLARPGDFGFADVTGTAKRGDVGTPGAVVPNPLAYLFWDPIHPSAAFHRLVGAAAVALIVP